MPIIPVKLPKAGSAYFPRIMWPDFPHRRRAWRVIPPASSALIHCRLICWKPCPFPFREQGLPALYRRKSCLYAVCGQYLSCAPQLYAVNRGMISPHRLLEIIAAEFTGGSDAGAAGRTTGIRLSLSFPFFPSAFPHQFPYLSQPVPF